MICYLIIYINECKLLKDHYRIDRWFVRLVLFSFLLVRVWNITMWCQLIIKRICIYFTQILHNGRFFCLTMISKMCQLDIHVHHAIECHQIHSRRPILCCFWNHSLFIQCLIKSFIWGYHEECSICDDCLWWGGVMVRMVGDLGLFVWGMHDHHERSVGIILNL